MITFAQRYRGPDSSVNSFWKQMLIHHIWLTRIQKWLPWHQLNHERKLSLRTSDFVDEPAHYSVFSPSCILRLSVTTGHYTGAHMSFTIQTVAYSCGCFHAIIWFKFSPRLVYETVTGSFSTVFYALWKTLWSTENLNNLDWKERMKTHCDTMETRWLQMGDFER